MYIFIQATEDDSGWEADFLIDGNNISRADIHTFCWQIADGMVRGIILFQSDACSRYLYFYF